MGWFSDLFVGRCSNCRTPFKGGIVEKYVKMDDGCYKKFCPRCARGLGVGSEYKKPGFNSDGTPKHTQGTRAGEQTRLW